MPKQNEEDRPRSNPKFPEGVGEKWLMHKAKSTR
jgi:hypothetical protein